MKLRAAATAVVLAASLLGGSAAQAYESPLPDGGYDLPGPPCYGGQYSYHVWNLFHPMEVYGIDSCTITLMVLYRRSGATFAQFLSALSAAKWPWVGIPAATLVFLWNSTTDAMAICAAPGTGVELTVSNLNGQVINCRAQS